MTPSSANASATDPAPLVPTHLEHNGMTWSTGPFGRTDASSGRIHRPVVEPRATSHVILHAYEKSDAVFQPNLHQGEGKFAVSYAAVVLLRHRLAAWARLAKLRDGCLVRAVLLALR